MEENNVQLNEQDEIIDDTPLLGQISFDELLAEIRYWLYNNQITQTADAWKCAGRCALYGNNKSIWLTPDAQQWLSIRR